MKAMRDRCAEGSGLTGELKVEDENVERNCCLGEEDCLKSDLSLPLLSPPFSCRGERGDGEEQGKKVVQKGN